MLDAPGSAAEDRGLEAEDRTVDRQEALTPDSRLSTIPENPSDFAEESLLRSDEPHVQHPCMLASQALLQACHGGASSEEPEADDCPSHSSGHVRRS
eukprot:14317786-Alexandrium_andersonii.AAC.1